MSLTIKEQIKKINILQNHILLLILAATCKVDNTKCEIFVLSIFQTTYYIISKISNEVVLSNILNK